MPRPIESSPMIANGPTGIGPPNSSAIAGDHARDLLAARRPRDRVGRVRVHDAADLGHVPVDVGVRRGVARRAALAAGRARDDVAVEVAEDHVLGREVVVRDARRLDHEQVGAGHAARDVAAGPDDEPVAHQLAVQLRRRPSGQPPSAASTSGIGGSRPCDLILLMLPVTSSASPGPFSAPFAGQT